MCSRNPTVAPSVENSPLLTKDGFSSKIGNYVAEATTGHEDQ